MSELLIALVAAHYFADKAHDYDMAGIEIVFCFITSLAASAYAVIILGTWGYHLVRWALQLAGG